MIRRRWSPQSDHEYGFVLMRLPYKFNRQQGVQMNKLFASILTSACLFGLPVVAQTTSSLTEQVVTTPPTSTSAVAEHEKPNTVVTASFQTYLLSRSTGATVFLNAVPIGVFNRLTAGAVLAALGCTAQGVSSTGGNYFDNFNCLIYNGTVKVNWLPSDFSVPTVTYYYNVP